MNSIIIIGGDKRQKELCGFLSDIGIKCKHIISDGEIDKNLKIQQGDTVILPIPLSKDKEKIYSSEGGLHLKINDVLKKVDSSNLILAGGFPETVKAYFNERNITYYDYLDSEELVLYNAYLTGLGAVRLLLDKTGEDIKNKKVLITGFGRVAKFTAQSLKDAGCDVYVTARKKLQLTEAECIGYKTVEFEKRESFLYLFDYIFNTVPENIFTQEDVFHIRGMYFELASSPYGVDREYFINRENYYFDAGSLPGRFIFRSAAEKLAEITLEFMNLRNGGD